MTGHCFYSTPDIFHIRLQSATEGSTRCCVNKNCCRDIFFANKLDKWILQYISFSQSTLTVLPEMGTKKKASELIFNLQWRHKLDNGGDKSNVIGMYDTPTTTSNFEMFKSYLVSVLIINSQTSSPTWRLIAAEKFRCCWQWRESYVSHWQWAGVGYWFPRVVWDRSECVSSEGEIGRNHFPQAGQNFKSDGEKTFEWCGNAIR